MNEKTTLSVGCKSLYIIPRCEIISLENEEFICTSTTGKASSSSEEEWDEKNNDSGGFDI